jgi:hypothetical protein
MGSRLIDAESVTFCVDGDGRVYRVRSDDELGLAPHGRKPTRAEIATTAKFAFMTAVQTATSGRARPVHAVARPQAARRARRLIHA